jgi:hypothetical protein
MNITIGIKNSTDAISFDLLKALNMPFREIKVEAIKGHAVDTTVSVAGIPDKTPATK